MAGLAGQVYVQPANRLAAGDHANGLVVVLEYRALFDMRFEIGIEWAGEGRIAGLADDLQAVGNAFAVGVFACQPVVERQGAGEHRRTQHGGREAGAFFVGPVRDFDRRTGLDIVFVERAYGFEGGQHAEYAIETSALGLGIQMAADHHRRAVRLPGPAREQVADGIPRYAQAFGLRPSHEQCPAGGIFGGQRQPAAAAVGGGADLGHRHQAVPQSWAVGFEHKRVELVKTERA